MSGLFRAQVIAQQQQRLQGEVSLTQPVSFIALTGLIIALVLCALAFLYFSEYQRKEQVQGTIEPMSTAVSQQAVGDILLSTQEHSGSPQADTLLAVVYVPVRIIELITLGQVVNMRIEALPYQRFGVQEGTVIALGSQVMTIHESQLQPLPEPSYRVVMALTTKHLPLTQGMKLEADISAAPRRLLAWLFEPRVNQKDEI